VSSAPELTAQGRAPAPRGLVRLALPSKGRLAEQAERLLHDAGIGFTPNGRTLHVHCLDLDLELLFARADDIPRWVADGAVELGITGQNVIVEAGVELVELLRLGFGGCRLAVAVPDGSPVQTLDDLHGRRVATSYRRTVEGALAARGIEAELVDLTGSVELSPRLGIADAVADLVSSGETLRQNGLREISDLLESQAVLAARPGLAGEQAALVEDIRLVLESVLAARPKRYLMLNVHDDRLEGVVRLLPGLDAPTVLPLSREGMHAVHAVIDADDVVRLLGPLRAAGASSLLVLPIEHLIP
jgi:ATP phosphoribosyltransferase